MRDPFSIRSSCVYIRYAQKLVNSGFNKCWEQQLDLCQTGFELQIDLSFLCQLLIYVLMFIHSSASSTTVSHMLLLNYICHEKSSPADSPRSLFFRARFREPAFNSMSWKFWDFRAFRQPYLMNSSVKCIVNTSVTTIPTRLFVE